MVHNNDSHDGGRIWIIWDASNYDVEVLRSEAQVVHTRVTFLPTGKAWWLSMVYGFNSLAERVGLWQCLKSMKNAVRGPWVVMGDFNNVLAMNERIGSEVTDAEVRDFQECVDYCGLCDIPAQDTITIYHPEGVFDHCPCTLRLTSEVRNQNRSFKYFNMWGKDPTFHNIVQARWSVQLYGYKMFQLVKKLKLLKHPLKELNRTGFANIETTAQVALKHLHSVQVQLQGDPTNVGLQQAVKNADLLYKDRGQALRSFLAQKAKAHWMRDGDDNSHYFHSVIKARRMQNRILGIYDMDGQKHTTSTDIEAAFINYYKHILGTQTKVDKVHLGIVQRGKFFKDSFEITGADLCGAVKEFFTAGRMLKQVNSTTLTLIPKKDRPVTVADFRPIACCNVVYKIISKVICAD
ncbi:uncharacterized protein LOC141640950 [Silene latifolia]|uniref:uncharacterized protein LOC141640950 n=1 Tax=Silene latifolia TaxID=37657 RepID=UPI003D76D228